MREMECHMDVEMFLDGYAGWGVGSPHLRDVPTHCGARVERGRMYDLPGLPTWPS